jgi:hypothetical protein
VTTKRGQGHVVVHSVRGPVTTTPVKGEILVHPQHAPVMAGVIFPRPDSPFVGDGQRVQLSRAEGYTPPNKLRVPFRFQLPPTEQIQKVSAFSWATFDVLDTDTGSSERSRPAGRRLKSLSINSMFLTWDPSWAVWSPGAGLMDPILAARELENLCDHGVRFRLRVANPKLYSHDDINMIAVITQCMVTEQTGEADTRYIQLDFQEYRPTEVERAAIHNTLGPWTHTIKDGDTLYKLAKHYYHRQSDWRRIANANQGLEHQPPSHNLISWRRKHRRKTIHIPQALDAKLPVAL